jgi:hypothetical protein
MEPQFGISMAAPEQKISLSAMMRLNREGFNSLSAIPGINLMQLSSATSIIFKYSKPSTPLFISYEIGKGKEMYMKILTKVVLVSAFLAVVALMPIPAQADQGNWSTKVTINQPMQIGDMVLKPGTYIFRRLDTIDPYTIEIYSVNTGDYDGVVMGIPAHRTIASDKTTLTFEQGKKGSPETLQYWFYPDTLNGVEFLPPQALSASSTFHHIAG